ncbi:hypothetical protein ACIPQA_16555 [Streptomyces sp. NPDC090109]|uniref:hypothetical protein n=1 Tax=Streptomyces sp. NPDC090109 TaxID=3365948 RepID=UPI0038080BE2
MSRADEVTAVIVRRYVLAQERLAAAAMEICEKGTEVFEAAEVEAKAAARAYVKRLRSLGFSAPYGVGR